MVVHQECRGCKALALRLAERAATPQDKEWHKQHVNPDSWRLDRVMTRAEAEQMQRR